MNQNMNSTNKFVQLSVHLQLYFILLKLIFFSLIKTSLSIISTFHILINCIENVKHSF